MYMTNKPFCQTSIFSFSFLFLKLVNSKNKNNENNINKTIKLGDHSGEAPANDMYKY